MDTKVILILAASLFVFCLLLFLFGFVLKYQKKTLSFLKEKELMESRSEQILLQSQVEVQESVFSVVSKELHDNVGQLLSTAKLLLGITERNTAEPPATLLTANETVGQAIKELRALSKSLNLEWLEQFSLIENLVIEVNRINSAQAIQLHLKHPDKILLAPGKQTILFRIVQEGIQNAIKHSSAKNIHIHIHQSGSLIITEITDDGTGFALQSLPDGIGMMNMKSRARLLSGTAVWKSGEAGSHVCITVPTQQNDE